MLLLFHVLALQPGHSTKNTCQDDNGTKLQLFSLWCTDDLAPFSTDQGATAAGTVVNVPASIHNPP